MSTIAYSDRTARGQVSVLVRLSPDQARWLEGKARPGEGRSTALKRLAKVPTPKAKPVK